MLAALVFAGCATPVVTLKNEASGQVVRCGGGVTGSMAGGLIGHNIEIANDENCVRDYESRGFKRVATGTGIGACPTAGQKATTLSTPPATTSPARPTRTAAATASGEYPHQVEHMAEAKSCNPEPSAVLVGKAQRVETYTVACRNGDVLTVRCELSACRVLR